MPWLTNNQKRIAEAIKEGVGDAYVCTVERNSDKEIDVFTSACDDPIIIQRDDVIVPTALDRWKPGILLDVRAVLAGF